MKAIDSDFRKFEVGLTLVVIFSVLATGIYAWNISRNDKRALASISSYDDCVEAGFAVKNTSNDRCETSGKVFIRGFSTYTDTTGEYTFKYPDDWIVTDNQSVSESSPTNAVAKQTTILTPSNQEEESGTIVVASIDSSVKEEIKAEWAIRGLIAEISQVDDKIIEYVHETITEEGAEVTEHTWLVTESDATVSVSYAEYVEEDVLENASSDTGTSEYVPDIETIASTIEVL